ncbi:type VI secretion system Vgr family protein [Pragia fontium]|uniref:Type VI secretion system secreted protein VgrG n=1 Tax=Pragia fontium DSM 5563 = ATCC 49100 TaxID=1122977 RepID=A0AAJ5BI22_9GAMM|nr:type VI secretion system tip protein TssI/VgrG [Pragia fontium]SFD17819.1 type VI secretion system secreted protein VgrG [Pragia fontium DSM 5563 = ATCC 49100]VEJ52899.1 Uncharacterized protein conserved in bacteria [Pragia fontium]
METGLYFSCKVGELLESSVDVINFTLEEALSTLFTLQIKVSSFDADIDLDALLLQPASLTVSADGVGLRIINGVISEAFRGGSGFKRTYYTFTIRPELWLLTLTQDNRIFHHKTIPAILDELLQKHHIRAESKLIDSHKSWEYTTQRNETDYAFFCRLAAEEGIVFWFEEEQLFYSDSRTGMLGGEKLLYNAHIQSASRESVIHNLEYGAKMQPNAVHLKDYKYSHPAVGLDAKVKSQGARPSYAMYEGYGRYDDDGVAQQYAKYRLQAYQADSLSGSAESNCIQLMPGKMFTLSEHPTPSMNSNWQVIRIVHHGSLPQAVADESHEGVRVAVLSNHFSFIPGSVDWRPPFIAKPMVFGNETATVVGPAGEEIFVNEHGEVKVHFHWNQYDPKDENASLWVRAGQAWNGDGFGVMAIPRIGQEVIIAYLNGDIDQPIIVGTVYNGKNATPISLPAKKTQTTIRTRTHKGEGFNELRFEDEASQEEIYIHAQKDMNTDVLNNRSTHVINNHTENVDNNQSMAVGVNQLLLVGNNQTNDIGSNRKTTIGHNDSLTVKANQAETIALTKAENIGIAKALSIGGAYQITTGGAMNTSVGGMQASEIGLTKSLLVGQKYTADIGQEVKWTIGNRKTETVGKVSIYNAGEHLELVCGKAKIVLTSDGGIYLKGEHIELQANSGLKGDANLVQWNCSATQSPPEASTESDSKDA